MTSAESYGMCPADDLQRHLATIDAQCLDALEHYNHLLVQRGIVLEALGVRAIENTPDVAASTQPIPSAAVA